MATRHEAGGADPGCLPTDCPSAVSETAGTSHRCASTHTDNATKERLGRSSAQKHPLKGGVPPDHRAHGHYGSTRSCRSAVRHEVARCE